MKSLVFLILAAPASLLAHGSEFLGVKLRVATTRELTLELTADYGENPMISSRDEAEAVLRNQLEAEVGGTFAPISQLSTLALEDRDKPDESSPLPTDTSGAPHQLLTAVWRWNPPTEAAQVRFRVPADVKCTAVFWLDEPGVAPDQRKWSMLIGGDVTPAIPLPSLQHSWLWPQIAVIFCGLVTFFFVTRSCPRFL